MAIQKKKTKEQNRENTHMRGQTDLKHHNELKNGNLKCMH